MGTVVIGIEPTDWKFPEIITFWELNSDTETSTWGLLRTFDKDFVRINLISSTVFPATLIMPAFG